MGVAQVAAVVLTLLTAVYWDTRARRIPNLLTYPSILAGFALGGLTNGISGIVASAAGVTIAVVIFAFPVLKLNIGFGDLKLVTALASIGGPSFALWMCLYSMVAGGLVGIVTLLRYRRKCRDRASVNCSGTLARMPTIPYSVPIAMGALFALMEGGWLTP